MKVGDLVNVRHPHKYKGVGLIISIGKTGLYRILTVGGDLIRAHWEVVEVINESR